MCKLFFWYAVYDVLGAAWGAAGLEAKVGVGAEAGTAAAEGMVVELNTACSKVGVLNVDCGPDGGNVRVLRIGVMRHLVGGRGKDGVKQKAIHEGEAKVTRWETQTGQGRGRGGAEEPRIRLIGGTVGRRRLVNRTNRTNSGCDRLYSPLTTALA